MASVTPSFVAKVRVGLPSPKSAVKNRDPGVTNVRHTDSPHWRRWLGSANRCLVPFTSFSEFNKGEGGNVWFALDESRPLAFFAGIHVPQWTSVRKVKAGEETADLYAFLTTERTPSSRRSIQGHAGDPDPSRAMGFLVARAWDEAQQLQQPLPDAMLMIVGRGWKEDVGAVLGTDLGITKEPDA